VVKHPFVEDPRDLLADGIAALRANEHWHAETFFIEAYQALSSRQRELNPHEFAMLKAACYGLGRVYRLTGRHELAVTILERALPNPVAFKDLIKAFRHLAEAAQTRGDPEARGGWYHRMYSLAKIHAVVAGLRSAQHPHTMDWQLGAKWIEELRTTHGTIYPFRFEGARIAGDALLTDEDYRGLEECRQDAIAAVQGQPVAPEQMLEIFDPPADEAPDLEISAVRSYGVELVDLGIERSWETDAGISQ
jgi:hypothetical protein